jgi:hypothetical protein
MRLDFDSHVSRYAVLSRRETARAVADKIAFVLASDNEPDAATIIWLSERDHYADAARLLRDCFRRTRLDWPNPIRHLTDRHAEPVRAWRLAHEFGAVAPTTKATAIFTTESLRRIAAGRDKRRAAKAREALAALGHIDWRTASRRERAAWLLGTVCRVRLERVS